MTPIITEIIPKQGFEIVLDRIHDILDVELLNQKTLQEFESEFEVFKERQEAYDNSEAVVIIVSLSNIAYAGKTQKDSQGGTDYFIDVYANGIESTDKTGNEDSRLKLHLFVGMIRYILDSTKYQTLGFDYSLNLIGGKYITGIQFPDNYDNQDASFNRFARITLNVRIQESQQAWDAIQLLGNDTTVKLDETEKGFKLTQTN